MQMTQVQLNQNHRRECLYKAFCESCEAQVAQASEEWVGDIALGPRDKMWLSLGLLRGSQGHRSWANRLLAGIIDDQNDFAAYFAYLILNKHAKELSDEALTNLRKIGSANIDKAYRHIFRYTENCAVLNCYALLEHARVTGDPRYSARAMDRLELFTARDHHSGVSLEFNSPNYLPVSLIGAAHLSQYSDHADAQKVGMHMESLLWREISAVWHPNLGYCVGASGRSYTADSTAGHSLIRTLVWLAVGESATDLAISPSLFSGPARWIYKGHSSPWNARMESAWIACEQFTVPDEFCRLMQALPDTRRVTSTVRLPPWREYLLEPESDPQSTGGWHSPSGAMIPGTILHPGGQAIQSTYLDSRVGLGTSTIPLWTMCDPLFAAWLPSPTSSRSAIHTLYTRLVLDNELEETLGMEPSGVLLPEKGRVAAAQHDNLGIIWFTPSDSHSKQVSRLRFCVLIYDPEAVIPTPSKVGEWFVWEQDGLCLAIRFSGKFRVEFKRVGRFLTFQETLFDGPTKDFHPSELRNTASAMAFYMQQASYAQVISQLESSSFHTDSYESHFMVQCNVGDRSIEVIAEKQLESLVSLKVGGEFLRERLFEVV